MNRQSSEHPPALFAASLAVVLVPLLLLVGCNNRMDSTNSTSSKSKSKIPKLKFHRPKSAPVAASRLREIHESLIADSNLPEPTKFTIIEIIHGEGRSAHSHYYLESDWDPESDHHHDEDMPTSQKTHQLEIGIFTELKDIAAWMPNIAAAANLSESQWEKVNQACKALEELIDQKIAGIETEQGKRQAYRLNAAALNEPISKLEFLCGSLKQK